MPHLIKKPVVIAGLPVMDVAPFNGAIEKIEELEGAKLAKIVEGIGALNPDTDYTKGGKPEIHALADLLGLEITALERDKAFEAFQSKEKPTGTQDVLGD
jgi:hypothetical protein